MDRRTPLLLASLLAVLLVLGTPRDVDASRRWITVTSIAELVSELEAAKPGARVQVRGSTNAATPTRLNDAYLHVHRVRGSKARPIRVR